MSNIGYMLVPFCAGIVLGAVFFGGLWLTVRMVVKNQITSGWMAVIFLFRSGISLTGFYIIAGTDLAPIMLCLLGFAVARFLVMRLTKPEAWQVNHTSKGGT